MMAAWSRLARQKSASRGGLSCERASAIPRNDTSLRRKQREVRDSILMLDIHTHEHRRSSNQARSTDIATHPPLQLHVSILSLHQGSSNSRDRLGKVKLWSQVCASHRRCQMPLKSTRKCVQGLLADLMGTTVCSSSRMVVSQF
jgi:hypothetical protein